MRLILFVACEKVIVAEQTHALSIITVMGSAEVRQADPNALIQVPANAILPMQWAILALWKPSNEDVGQQFTQQFRVFWPSSEQFAEAIVPFSPPAAKAHPVYVNIIGFPAGQVGDVIVRSWLEQSAERITEDAEYAIRVEHTLQTAPTLP